MLNTLKSVNPSSPAAIAASALLGLIPGAAQSENLYPELGELIAQNLAAGKLPAAWVLRALSLLGSARFQATGDRIDPTDYAVLVALIERREHLDREASIQAILNNILVEKNKGAVYVFE